MKLLKKIKIKNYYTYGTNNKSQFKIKSIKQKRDYSVFSLDIKLPGKKNIIIKNLKIPLLGIHNIRNATASAAVAITIGISKNIIRKSLKEFKGVQRRFNKVFTYRGIEFYDDYAHHPTEITEVLKGVKQGYKKEEIICIFQPHRISRLNDLRSEFSASFKNADCVILCPIYLAGEKLKLRFNYLNFSKEIIKNSKVKLYLVKDLKELANYVKQNIYGKKIVIGMGAGSISNWMEGITKFDMKIDDELKQFTNEVGGSLLFDYDLKKNNWFNIGGKTKRFFKPESLKDLSNFIKKFGT